MGRTLSLYLECKMTQTCNNNKTGEPVEMGNKQKFTFTLSIAATV